MRHRNSENESRSHCARDSAVILNYSHLYGCLALPHSGLDKVPYTSELPTASRTPCSDIAIEQC